MVQGCWDLCRRRRESVSSRSTEHGMFLCRSRPSGTCSLRSALQWMWWWSTSRAPDQEIFGALAPSVEAMVLLAGSGICDLVCASAIAQHLTAACPDVWLCLRISGKGGHRADTVAGAPDLPLLAVVCEEPHLDADVLHGVPPGSSAKGALAAAANIVLARCVGGVRQDAL